MGNCIQMENHKQREDFNTLWNRRKQNWQEYATKAAPDDEAMLRMAETAQHQASATETPAITITKRRNRWIPYAAAASILIGVAVIGWQRISSGLRHIEFEEVSVEGQTIRFLCNSGCSADDVLQSAQNIITE